jgi:hypothetical protein
VNIGKDSIEGGTTRLVCLLALAIQSAARQECRSGFPGSSGTQAGCRDSSTASRGAAPIAERAGRWQHQCLAFIGLDGLSSSMLDALPETDSNRRHPVGFQGIGGGRPTPRGGRPKLAPDICELIGETSVANPLWRAPRIHGKVGGSEKLAARPLACQPSDAQ